MGLFYTEGQKVSKWDTFRKAYSRQGFKKNAYYYQSQLSEQGCPLFIVRPNEKSMTFGGRRLSFKSLFLHFLIL